MANHIDRFDEVATQILRALHRGFPDPVGILPNTIGLTDEQPTTENGRRLASAEWEALNNEMISALRWLVDEGFVLKREQKTGSSHVITSKGLRSLASYDGGYEAPRVS